MACDARFGGGRFTSLKSTEVVLKEIFSEINPLNSVVTIPETLYFSQAKIMHF